MLWVALGIGACVMILERIFPDQVLPKVPGWWGRVILINLAQLGVVLLGGYTYDLWFQKARLLHLSESLPPALAGLVSYCCLTFVYYWWHRARHEVNFLWLLCHQVHHSPNRIETITSFYKHPVEILANGLIIGFFSFTVLGISTEAGGWVTLYSALGEYFYHMNIKTARWVGYFIQRPEMHRIHHERGKHFSNFADFPVWDMLFGTYKNPETYQGLCGFKPEREQRLWDMLRFRNVNANMNATVRKSS